MNWEERAGAYEIEWSVVSYETLQAEAIAKAEADLEEPNYFTGLDFGVSDTIGMAVINIGAVRTLQINSVALVPVSASQQVPMVFSAQNVTWPPKI